MGMIPEFTASGSPGPAVGAPASPVASRLINGFDNSDIRNEKLRAEFQREGTAGRAEDARKQDKKRRIAYAALAVAAALGGVVTVIVRLTQGIPPAADWLGLCSGGIALAAVGAVLVLRGRPRLALATVVAAFALIQVADAMSWKAG
ncbi:hypothetical protein [Streptomyces sp. NPDC017993]|uniref:hypothetical protein n=1 Tax=Streptomyces sp. NPDC017993 TaxID=3365027 RepID=UPI0037A9EA15